MAGTRDAGTESAWRAAREAWPDVRADAETFRVRWAEAKPEHGNDVYLAVACEGADAAALGALDALLATEVPKAVAHLRLPASMAGDVRQLLLERLVVGAGAKISMYRGKGPLKAWLRSAAVRLAIDVMRTQRPTQPLERAELAVRAGPDPQVAHLRRRFAGPLKAAVESALKALPIDERNALRLYFLEGMTVEEVSRLRGVHKSNGTRWIARIRRAILADVKLKLKDELEVSDTELESILRLVQSQLDVSVERALK